MENNIVYMGKFRGKEKELKISQVEKKSIANAICTYGLIRELLKTKIKQTFRFKNK